MQRKKKDRVAETARPYGTLAAIRVLLDKFEPPAGSFDPRGAWRHSYAIWLEGRPAAVGYLEIGREPAGAGSKLAVESGVLHDAGSTQQTRASILCDGDALSTPRSWELESAILDPQGQVVPGTRFGHKAAVKGAAIEAEFGRHRRASKLAPPFTSNWGLFEAVQRLSGEATKPLAFTLLEDLDLVKANQRLSFVEKTTVAAGGGRQLALTGYERTGDGVLPYHYWVDEQRRLLFTISGPRAYVYDPEARSHVQGRRGARRPA